MDDQLHAARPSPVRWRVPRTVWHAAGLLAAGALGWLLWLGYRQPGFVLDIANLGLC